MSEHVTIFEMGPRDGLQNEKAMIAPSDKIRLVDMLTACGFHKIEVTSFVSPKWVPQMADAAEVLAGLSRAPGVSYAALKVMRTLEELEASPSSRQIHMRALDNDYEFHKRIVDFQRNEIFSRYYSLNAARLRLFRINLGEPLARLDTAAREHLEILNACAAGDPELAGNLLEKHIEISREHTLGVRPMRR